MHEEYENFRSDLIKWFFRDPNLEEGLYNQLVNVLSVQASRREGPEVGGSIFFDKELELRVIDDLSGRERVELALKAFESGNYSQMETLYQFARYFLRAVKAKGDPSSIALVNTLVKTFTPCTGQQDSIPEDLRKYAADLFRKTMLNSSYIPTKSYVNQIGKSGFIGLFHVHYSSGEPSMGDILKNKETHIPELVIAANFKPRTELEALLINACQIYLVHNGSFENIYNNIFKYDSDSKKLDLIHV